MKLPRLLFCAALLAGSQLAGFHADARPSASYSSRSVSVSRPSFTPPRTTTSGYGGSSQTRAASPFSSRSEQKQVNAISGSSLRNYETAKAERKAAQAQMRAAQKAERMNMSGDSNVPRVASPAPAPTPTPPQSTRTPQYQQPQQNGVSPMTAFGAGMLAEHLMNSGHHTAQAAPAPSPSQDNWSSPAPSSANDADVVPNDFGGQDTEAPQSAPSSTTQSTSVPTLGGGTPHNTEQKHGIGGLLFFLFMIILAIIVIYWLFKQSQSKEMGGHSQPKKETSHGSLMSGLRNVSERNQGGGNSIVPLGAAINLPSLSLMNDPSAPDDAKLHFEAGETGAQSVVAISHDSREVGVPSEMELYVSPDGSMEDFVLIHPNDKTARFFSWIDDVSPGTQSEWDEWLNDESGILGLPTFQTKDGVTWSRVLMSQSPRRFAPLDRTVDIETTDGTTHHQQKSMMYVRDTGFKAPYSSKEYLLVRVDAWMEDGVENAIIHLYAGVDVPWSSLGLD